MYDMRDHSDDVSEPGLEASRLATLRLTTATHSSRCLEAFHRSSAVSGWWSIATWANGRHSLVFMLSQLSIKLISQGISALFHFTAGIIDIDRMTTVLFLRESLSTEHSLI